MKKRIGTDLIIGYEENGFFAQFAYARSCEFFIKRDMKEVSSLDSSQAKEYRPGRYEWSMLCKCLLASDTSKIQQMFKSGRKIKARWKDISPDFDVHEVFDGYAYINELKRSGTIHQMATFDIKLQGTGELTDSVDEGESVIVRYGYTSQTISGVISYVYTFDVVEGVPVEDVVITGSNGFGTVTIPVGITTMTYTSLVESQSLSVETSPRQIVTLQCENKTYQCTWDYVYEDGQYNVRLDFDRELEEDATLYIGTETFQRHDLNEGIRSYEFVTTADMNSASLSIESLDTITYAISKVEHGGDLFNFLYWNISKDINGTYLLFAIKEAIDSDINIRVETPDDWTTVTLSAGETEIMESVSDLITGEATITAEDDDNAYHWTCVKRQILKVIITKDNSIVTGTSEYAVDEDVFVVLNNDEYSKIRIPSGSRTGTLSYQGDIRNHSGYSELKDYKIATYMNRATIMIYLEAEPYGGSTCLLRPRVDQEYDYDISIIWTRQDETVVQTIIPSGYTRAPQGLLYNDQLYVPNVAEFEAIGNGVAYEFQIVNL